MNDLTVHLYTVCHNEEFMVPYFLRHYDPIVSQIFVFDNQSTDRSRDLFLANPKVTIQQFDTGNEYREDILTRIRNQAWKNSRKSADLIIVCDIDEFLYHSNLPGFLQAFKAGDKSMARPFGFEMVSETLPKTEGQLYEEVDRGVRAYQWDKMVLFDPKQILNTNYFPGSHMALPEGRIRYHKEDPDLKLLHFRYLGLDYILKKYESRASRYSVSNRKNNWGFHYLFDEEKIRQIFSSTLEKSEKVIDG